MPKTSAKRRNRFNRQRGKSFEYQVERRLLDMGYQADRIFYSGAGAKEPYDVQVTFRPDDLLKIEAKRTFKKSMTFDTTWIDQVDDRHAIVFSVGKGCPGRPLKMYAMSKWASTTPPYVSKQRVKVGRKFKDMMVASFELPVCIEIGVASDKLKCFVISTNGQATKRIQGADLMHHTMLEHKGSFYLIEDLADYMNRTWKWKLGDRHDGKDHD